MKDNKGALKENRTLPAIFLAACEFAAEKGFVDEKTLHKKLKIRIPTAVKIICAMDIAGYLGERIGKGFVFSCGKCNLEEVRGRVARLDSKYLPLVESDEAFAETGYDGYVRGILLPALKTGIFYGSLSVTFLERKLSVVYERACEVYDLLGVAGFLGADDEINPGRKLMTIGYDGYDAVYARAESRK